MPHVNMLQEGLVVAKGVIEEDEENVESTILNAS